MVKTKDMNFYNNLNLRTNDPVESAEMIKETLKNTKVLKVTPEWYLGDLRLFYDKLVDYLGPVVNGGEDFTKGGVLTGERWLEIRYDDDIPDLAAYRHSKNAQPLHTDESYLTNPADIMLFYCVNKAPAGGATTFIDGQVLVDYMKKNAPIMLDDLTSKSICYRKADEARTEKIIDIQDNGKITLNFNYYCIDPNETEENKKLNKEFFTFLQEYIAHSHLVERVYLNPGESVLWWDQYVLHGRTSYEAKKTNDRYIWKTGFKWVG